MSDCRINRNDSAIVIILIGNFGNDTEINFEDIEIDRDNIIIDCKKLEFLYSFGANCLIQLYKKLENRGKFVVSGIHGQAENTLKILGFDSETIKKMLRFLNFSMVLIKK